LLYNKRYIGIEAKHNRGCVRDRMSLRSLVTTRLSYSFFTMCIYLYFCILYNRKAFQLNNYSVGEVWSLRKKIIIIVAVTVVFLAIVVECFVGLQGVH